MRGKSFSFFFLQVHIPYTKCIRVLVEYPCIGPDSQQYPYINNNTQNAGKEQGGRGESISKLDESGSGWQLPIVLRTSYTGSDGSHRVAVSKAKSPVQLVYIDAPPGLFRVLSLFLSDFICVIVFLTTIPAHPSPWAKTANPVGS